MKSSNGHNHINVDATGKRLAVINSVLLGGTAIAIAVKALDRLNSPGIYRLRQAQMSL